MVGGLVCHPIETEIIKGAEKAPFLCPKRLKDKSFLSIEISGVLDCSPLDPVRFWNKFSTLHSALPKMLMLLFFK